MRASIVSVAATLLLLGCDAEAHIRLLAPDDDVTELDAGQLAPPPPDAGTDDMPSEPPERELPESEPPESEPPNAGPESGPPPVDSLVLRYDFSGSGEVVPDLVGDRDAHLFGGTLLDPSRNFINLDGVDDYVDLPNGVVSELRSATFVAWFTWAGGVCWQRIFDFGISDQGEGQVGDVVTSLFLTPRACGDDTLTAMAELGTTQYSVSDDEALPSGYALQVALVVDDDAQSFSLYRDTEKVGEAPLSFRLDQLTDDNNWLGRSQWTQDAFFKGAIGEFRIYSRALGADEIAQIRAEGFETP